MDSELIKILKSLKDDAEFRPGTEFRTELKNQLMAAVPNTGWFIAWEMPWKNWSRRLAPAVAGLVLMLMGATVVMAQKSLPADLLYPVKIAGERAAMAIMPTGRQKVEAAAAIVDRRLWEVEQLRAKHEDEAAGAAITNYREHLVRAENFRDEADEIWTGRIDQHWQTLEQLEKKPEGGIEERGLPELPELPVEIPVETETAPTIVVPTTSATPAEEKDKDDKQKNKDVSLPEIQITIPAPDDLLSPILP